MSTRPSPRSSATVMERWPIPYPKGRKLYHTCKIPTRDLSEEILSAGTRQPHWTGLAQMVARPQEMQRNRVQLFQMPQTWCLQTHPRLYKYKRIAKSWEWLILLEVGKIMIRPISPWSGVTMLSPSELRFVPRWLMAEQISRYYRLIHTTHPLLADTKLQVLLNLDKVIDALVRDAFFGSLQALVKSISPGSASQQQDVRAAELLISLNFKDAATRTSNDNLVYLQAILLMALATDMSGPAISQQPIWYNLAGIMADFLGLGVGPPYKEIADPEIEYSKLARRAWLVFITLDRWHASGTLSRSIMPDDVTLFPHDDHALLGGNGFHLLRKQLSIFDTLESARY